MVTVVASRDAFGVAQLDRPAIQTVFAFIANAVAVDIAELLSADRNGQTSAARSGGASKQVLNTKPPDVGLANGRLSSV